MKYCESCGKENNDSHEMCIDCGGLIFTQNKPKINNNPSLFVSILSFVFPLIGIIIASFCENNKKRKRYRKYALFGLIFYLILALINKCIVEENYRREMDRMVEEIFKRTN